MSKRVMIVDYGAGNLFSVRRAVEVSGGADVVVSSRPADIDGADFLILPGVGAFEMGMSGLRERGLVDPIKAFAHSGRPLLGICLGMQMLASSSEEFGVHAGLVLIPGAVRPIPRISTNDVSIKVPFIGWAPLIVENPATADSGLLKGYSGSASVYLVHSFHVVPADPAHLLASYVLGGHRITSAIGRDNIVGVQFHPEKSGEIGLSMMRRFLAGDRAQ